MRGGPIDTQEALRTTSDALVRDLDALNDLEEEKRRTPHGDPRLVELAHEVALVAQRVLAGSRRELSLSQSVNQTAAKGRTDPDATIVDTPRPLSAILADWRAAERDAQTAVPGSVEARDARARADLFREEYRATFEAANGPSGTT